MKNREITAPTQIHEASDSITKGRKRVAILAGTLCAVATLAGCSVERQDYTSRQEHKVAKGVPVYDSYRGAGALSACATTSGEATAIPIDEVVNDRHNLAQKGQVSMFEFNSDELRLDTADDCDTTVWVYANQAPAA